MLEPADYLSELNHVGIVTEDLDELLARLQAIFSIRDDDVERLDNGSVRFAFFSIGGTPYEVIEPVSEQSKATILKTGTGVNHVCYAVSDIDGAVKAMAARGVRLGHVTPHGIVDAPGFRMAYFNPDDCAGVLVEFKEFIADGDHPRKV